MPKPDPTIGMLWRDFRRLLMLATCLFAVKLLPTDQEQSGLRKLIEVFCQRFPLETEPDG